MKYFLLLLGGFIACTVQAQSTRSFIGLSAARTTIEAIQFADVDGGGSADGDHGYRLGGQYQRLFKQ